MSDSMSFTNFFNKSFGMNIKMPEKTIQQAGKTLEDTASGVFSPLFEYLEDNEKVFTGDIALEINKKHAAAFNIAAAMQMAHDETNSTAQKFDSQF